jgi:DNA polymerase alpha subunit B
LDSVPGSIALIVPSVRDLVSDHAVFPQGELSADVTRGDPVRPFIYSRGTLFICPWCLQRIHLLPNPAWFTLNDVTFAATSADVLFHIRKGEFVKRGEEVDPTAPMSAEDTGSDPMANVCRHLLQQRSCVLLVLSPGKLLMRQQFLPRLPGAARADFGGGSRRHAHGAAAARWRR